MKPIKYLILSVIALTLAVSCSTGNKEIADRMQNKNAIWLWGKHMKEAPVQEWAEKGYRHILLNEAAFERWGDEEVYAFMDQCDKMGMTVHVWFQAFYFDGKWVSPIDDEKKAIKQDFYDMVIDRAKGYVEKGVKGIHLDYIRYGGTAHKHDYPECRATDSITEFCRQLNVAVKAINPDVILSAALMPEIDSEYYYGQNPAEMAKHLDILMPMVYRYGYAGEDKSLEWVNEVSNWFVEKAGENAEVWVGIQTYTVDLEKVDEGEHVVAMNAEQLYSDCVDITNTNAAGLVLFRYGIGDFPDVSKLWK